MSAVSASWARVRLSPGAHRVRVSRRWLALTLLVLALYVLLTLTIIYRTPVLSWDTGVVELRMRHNYASWLPYVYYYVMLGQRGPATLACLPLFLWWSWRDRTSRPLVMLVTSLILLNVSVGIVKLFTGRVGPRHSNNTHEFFVGGTVYPSGHVSNAVVLYGVIAILAVNRRKLVTALAVFLSLSLGFGTIFLRTHWFTDVIGGWLAGALVLLALPVVMPTAQAWTDAATTWVRRRVGRRSRDLEPPGGHQRIPSVRSVRVLPAAEVGGGHARTAGDPQTEKVTPVSSDA